MILNDDEITKTFDPSSNLYINNRCFLYSCEFCNFIIKFVYILLKEAIITLTALKQSKHMGTYYFYSSHPVMNEQDEETIP
ncbi:hypothetical protein BLOT_016727 [Blomia tropicalis]|nr:hypothetical protein BLOT_016727 [Blomia tropicalis]